ncbi:unnamed protein product [Caenorhabditis bovis]|uniref:CUB domain-containing protein n=1 Tax=Caenorhabditis bovis TaxID=2654633 RepID=A0A8S1E8Z1_9PELO|nr:unnamed protein product [Caenorhabditis bovis]
MNLVFVILPLFANLAFGQISYSQNSGIIYSTNYPQSYENNENLEITISVQNGNYIHLSFLDFLTEDPYDSLEVFTGIGENKVSLKTYSGEQTGEYLDILDTKATLIFKTDLTTVYRGFAIQYDSVAEGTIYTPENSCPSPVHNQQFGIVLSPNFPMNYPNNISCSYLLLAEKDHVISLEFVAFNTENGYDVVYIYDGSNTSYPLIGSFSGTNRPPSVTSTGPSIFIFFKTDLTTSYSGFSALYTSNISSQNFRKGVLPQA